VFKNLIVYRIAPEWSATLAQAEEGLDKARFTECGATQPQSSGWVEPRGHANGPLVETVDGQWLLALMVEQKMLPGSVVKRRVQEMAQHIEASTGRKPGRKESKDLAEQATLELLPQAFTKQGKVKVWVDPDVHLLMIDAGSAKRAEDVVTQLVKAWPGFAVQPLQTNLSPAVAMSAWLAEGTAPGAFGIARECELKSPDEMKSVVRYARHVLDTDDVRQHLTLGKVPTRLALTWDGRVSFVLTDTLQIKKIAFDDVVFESHKGSQNHQDEAFDADAAIATGELCKLIPDLIEALDGEMEPGAAPVAPAVPVATSVPAAKAPALATADDAQRPPWE
jgi:recombination associated protein RdgC